MLKCASMQTVPFQSCVSLRFSHCFGELSVGVRGFVLPNLAVLWVQFPLDISSNTPGGQENQELIATTSPNLSDPSHRRADAIFETAATLKDPSLAAPPANSSQVNSAVYNSLACHNTTSPAAST